MKPFRLFQLSDEKKNKCNHANTFSYDNLYFLVNRSVTVSLIGVWVGKRDSIISGNVFYRRAEGWEGKPGVASPRQDRNAPFRSAE